MKFFFEVIFFVGLLIGIFIFLIGIFKNIFIFPKNSFRFFRLFFLKNYYTDEEKILAKKALRIKIIGFGLAAACALFLSALDNL